MEFWIALAAIEAVKLSEILSFWYWQGSSNSWDGVMQPLSQRGVYKFMSYVMNIPSRHIEVHTESLLHPQSLGPWYIQGQGVVKLVSLPSQQEGLSTYQKLLLLGCFIVSTNSTEFLRLEWGLGKSARLRWETQEKVLSLEWTHCLVTSLFPSVRRLSPDCCVDMHFCFHVSPITPALWKFST